MKDDIRGGAATIKMNAEKGNPTPKEEVPYAGIHNRLPELQPWKSSKHQACLALILADDVIQQSDVPHAPPSAAAGQKESSLTPLIAYRVRSKSAHEAYQHLGDRRRLERSPREAAI